MHQFTKPWNIRVSQNYVWLDQSYHRLSLNLDISNRINPGCVYHRLNLQLSLKWMPVAIFQSPLDFLLLDKHVHYFCESKQ